MKKSSRNYHFDEIFSRLKKTSKNWKNPIVTEVSEVEKDPYFTLFSCLLSLRTKDAVTAEASKRLFSKAPNLKKLNQLSVKEIEKLIYPVGFYRTKAKRVKEIARVLIKNYNSEVPDTVDELLKLKGVGRKTANIVMVYGHKKTNHLPIDTHCHRIPNRLGWVKTKNPEETEKALEKILPKKYWYDFNDLFVQFGQNICVPISPFCSKCSINKYCPKIGVKRSR